jgi:NADH-quinone oxidoreductase subunit M
VGIDGLSLWLVILTTFLTPLALLGSWSSIDRRVREFNVFMLLLEAGCSGSSCPRPLPLLHLLGGHADPDVLPDRDLGPRAPDLRRGEVLPLHHGGSVLMLVAFLVVYRAAGVNSFDIAALSQVPVDPRLQMWLFAAFALAFAIKVPMFPFHTWLPDAHVEAPTAGSVILAGVLLKMGGYGFLRLAIPLFPQAAVAFAPWIGALAVIGIVYGALVSLVQPDLKKLVAYSSVSHLGFVMLGIASLTTTSVVGRCTRC